MNGLRRGALIVVLALVGALASPAIASATDGALDVESMSLAEIADEIVQCMDIDGENYCLYIGFTDLRPGTRQWARTFNETWQPGNDDPAGSPQGYVWHVAQLSAKERKALEMQEVQDAYSAVGKVKLYDHVGLDIPMPAGFFDQYPELGIDEGSPLANMLRNASQLGGELDMSAFHNPTRAEQREEAGHLAALGLEQPEYVAGSPTYRYLIYSAYRKQVRNDFCGPATFQALDGGDDGYFESQYFWDDYVGYWSGNSFSAHDVLIKNSINTYTNWDNKAGTYALVDTTGKTASWYFDVHQINIGIDGAIVVEHVKLWDQFYTYLARDHGGHFQTGRGYSRNSNTISIFEPLNEADFDQNGNHTGKVQYVNYTNVFNANQAYPSNMETIIY